MSTLSVSMPDGLKAFVDERVADQGYATSDEYIRNLIEQDREQLRLLLLEGAASPPDQPADENYFAELLERIRSNPLK